MSPREAFLQNVRSAVHAGNRAGAAPRAAPRGAVGYQGAGNDACARFCTELVAAGGIPHLVAEPTQVAPIVAKIVSEQAARKILFSRGGLVERLDLAGHLRAQGLDVQFVDTLHEPSGRELAFAADVGISNVHRLVAETGTVVVASTPHEPRAVSLLPPVHIAIAERSQLLHDLFDLFDLFAPTPGQPAPLPPSCLSLITGPSKTGDIELRLVTGVHGPGAIHVILGTW